MPLTILFVVVSLFSIVFMVRRYRTATPEQQGQILFAGIGTALLALGIGAFIYFH